MATAKPEQANEDILTCTVCCTIYVDPCTLNCQHTFCRTCITSYLKSHSEAVKKHVIPCPSCRQITNVPHPTKPVEEWADTIEVSAIEALMDTVKIDKNQGECAESCSLCLKIEETTPGVKWCLECEVNLCDRCAKLHPHQTTHDHDLCDLADKGKVKKKLLHNTIDGRTDSDEKTPAIRNITVLVLDGHRTIVATDIRNKCVKSFYRRNNCSLNDKLSLDNSPYGITKLKENQVMVYVKDSRQIVTIAVNPELQLLSTVTTNNEYESLAVLGTSSLVAGRIDNYVDILNMEGQVMKSVSRHNDVQIIKFPDYIAVNNKGNVFVSDWGLKSVICVSHSGDVLWTYSPSGDKALSSPRGITTTSLGQVLLADSKANKVILLTESGEYVRDVLTAKDGISNPYSIALDGHGSLFVCGGREIKEFIFL